MVGRLVAELDDKVAGWVALSPYSSRQVYSGGDEIGVYIEPNYEGQGIGTTLINAVLEIYKQKGVWTVQASIFPENIASLALHNKFDIRVIGRRERIAKHKGYGEMY